MSLKVLVRRRPAHKSKLTNTKKTVLDHGTDNHIVKSYVKVEMMIEHEA